MLEFIKDRGLRKIIEDSIEYVNFLFDQAKVNSNKVHQEETLRVVVLYIVSTIEAILLYVVKQRGDKITTTVYKEPSELPKSIKHSSRLKGKLVIALQCKEAKKDQQIGVRDLVRFMENRKLMKSETADSILKINDIRNTFHLSKSRSDLSVETKKVEQAFSLLYIIIKGAPKAINKK